MTGTHGSCSSCGEPRGDIDAFCESCGARVPGSGIDRRDRSEIDLGYVAGVTDRGRSHERNEDAFFVAAADGHALVVVCDGVSTSSEPARAAQLGADTAGESLVGAFRAAAESPSWDPVRATTVAIEAAHAAVCSLDRGVDDSDPPACTLASVVWDGHELTIGWVGDSRVYWITASDAARMTVDDSWAEADQERVERQQVEGGSIGPHVITRWLGADAPSGAPGISRLVPDASGRVIVCSDGLWNYAPSAPEIGSLVHDRARDSDPLAVARSLTGAALAAGGRDNVTVGVLEVQPANEPDNLRRGGR